MDSSLVSVEDVNVEQEWTISFHGVGYGIYLEATAAGLLVLEVEEAESGNRWTAEFTSQYIEEITQRAGSFKKFSTFVRMLTSALRRENDSVFVDLLTYSDLELLKARKMGSLSLNTSANASSSSNASVSRSKEKRYMILTYTSEFDRVHYPLPLAPQKEPDVESLQRMIRRLRAALQEKRSDDQVKDDKASVVVLRQENTELRHRLRQLESRMTPAGTAPASATSVSASQQNGEVMLAYNKLKRQYDAVRRELHSATLAYERLRTESAKEIAKYKALNASGRQDVSDAEVITKLKNQCKQLRQQLETEKAEHRRTILRQQRELSNLKHTGHPILPSSGLPPRPARSTTPTDALRERRPASSSRQSNSSSRRSTSTQGSLSLTNSRDLARSLTPTSSLTKGRGVSGSERPASAGAGSRSRPTTSSSSSAVAAHRDRSRSSSPQPQISSQRPPWNAGGKHNTRYSSHESGYTSATSQSSYDSRRSRGSRASSASASARSDASGTSSVRKQKRRAAAAAAREEEDRLRRMSSAPRDVDVGGTSHKKKSSSLSSSRRAREGIAEEEEVYGSIKADVSDDMPRRSKKSSSSSSGKKSKKTSKRSGHGDADSSLELLDGAATGALSDIGHSDVEYDPMMAKRRNAAATTSTAIAAAPGGSDRGTWAVSRHTSTANNNNSNYNAAAAVMRRSGDSDHIVDSPTTRAQRDVMASLSLDALGGGGGSSNRGAVLGRRLPDKTLRASREEEDYGEEEEVALGRAFDGLKMTRREKKADAVGVNDTVSSGANRTAAAAAVSDFNSAVRSSRDNPNAVSTSSTTQGVTTTSSTTTTSANSSSVNVDSSSKRASAAPVAEGEQDISEIDKRIKALQSFLDKARSGILGDAQDN